MMIVYSSPALLMVLSVLALLNLHSIEAFSHNQQPRTDDVGVGRREWLTNTVGIAVGAGGVLVPQVAPVLASTTDQQPIAVLGASGRTGAL